MRLTQPCSWSKQHLLPHCSAIIRRPSLCRLSQSSQVCFRPSRCFATVRAAVRERSETSRTPSFRSVDTLNFDKNFESLGLGKDLLAAIKERRFEAPTEIQSAAIPEILRGGDLLLASHTGSGKTLAYLLPLVKKLKDSENGEGSAARPRRPRALVLGPTRELTDQILGVAKMLSHHAKFRSACVNGGGSLAQQANSLERPLDILIGTPLKIMQQAEKRNLFFGDVQYVVLDEADTMFDKGFGPEVRAVLKPVRSKENPAQCTLVLATLTSEIQKVLNKEFPAMRHVKTRSLNKGVSTARHNFVPVPALENKLDHLSQVVSADVNQGRRIMIFCNTLDSCRATDYFLRERGFDVCCCHGDIPLDGRKEAIKRFSPPEGAENPKEIPIMVCTDLAARGLDMPAQVHHVVNFDFPYNPVDYIHRAGRTARAGMAGKVTSLLQKRDMTLATRIQDAIRHDRPLDDLSATKSELPPNLRPKPETLRRQQQERKAEQNSRKGRRGAARFEPPKTVVSSRVKRAAPSRSPSSGWSKQSEAASGWKSGGAESRHAASRARQKNANFASRLATTGKPSRTPRESFANRFSKSPGASQFQSSPEQEPGTERGPIADQGNRKFARKLRRAATTQSFKR